MEKYYHREIRVVKGTQALKFFENRQTNSFQVFW
jgi:hypothetical protein